MFPNRWGHEQFRKTERGEYERPAPLSLAHIVVDTRLPELIPTVDNPQASLPAAQFHSQLATERVWILDEAIFQNPHAPVLADANEQAYRDVRDCWVCDGIWKAQWDGGNGMPFGVWPHEGPNQSEANVREVS